MVLSQADLIAHTLKKQGVSVVFGLPGGENVPLVAAMDKVGLRFVLMRHESRAVWAADAYGRINRSIGVCLSTLGPGAVNLAAGLAHAYLDRSPVLAITAQLPEDVLDLHTHQYVDLLSVFAPVSKAVYVIKKESDAAGIMQKAMLTAAQGRQGPVYVQISSPVSQEPAPPSTFKTSSAQPNDVKEETLNKAIRLLHTARRPAIVVGLAIEPSAPYVLLRTLAEKLQAAVVVTPKAKGSISEKHKLYAGVLGLERKETAADILHQADVILGIGFDPVELMVPWSFNAPYICVSPAPNFDPVLDAEVELIGNLSDVLQCLLDRTVAESEGERKNWLPSLSQPGMGGEDHFVSGTRLLPSHLVQVARSMLPDNGVVTVDVGAHKLFIGKHWEARNPNRFLLSNGLSTMGYALPAAIGAKLARPDLPVVCFTGDGGLGMVDSELETAVRAGLPVVVVVLADEAMSLIRLKQTASGHKATGTLMGPTDWVKIARGFGAYGKVACDAESFRHAFENALSADKVSLIEARIDAEAYQTF